MHDKSIEKHDDFTVIMYESDDHVPLYCPVCQLLMASRDDVMSFSAYQCCNTCEHDWIIGRIDRWIGGWRPDASTICLMHEMRGFL